MVAKIGQKSISCATIELMRYLGIDFGSKNVGVAVSDETGRFAMPYAVWQNGKNLITDIANLCTKEGIEKIIIGKSLDYNMKPNSILAASESFSEELQAKTNLPLDWELEFLTSQAAKREMPDDAMHDARAAALILQSYLDRQKSVD